MIAMDRSLGLLQIAQNQGEFGLPSNASTSFEGKSVRASANLREGSVKGKERAIGECVRGDLANLGWREGVFVSFPIYLQL